MLNFTNSDLEANRAGYMTEKQRHLIRNLFLIRLFLRAIMCLIPIWVLVGAYQRGTATFLQDNANAQYLFATGLIFCYCCLIGYIIRQVRKDYHKVLSSYAVEAVQGTLYREMKSTGSGKRTFRHFYYVRIGKTQFHVEPEIFQAFVDNAIYTLYFVGRTLLSAERH